MTIESEYRNKHLASAAYYEKQIQLAFDRLIKKFVNKYANSPIISYNDNFQFSTNKKLNAELTEMMQGFYSELFEVTNSAVKSSWGIANEMNDELVTYFFKGLDQFKNQQPAMMGRNTEAMNAFVGRTRNSRTLSDRIWIISDRFRDELEANLLIGMADGKSAAEIAGQIKGYLKNPDNLFRQVRDVQGDLRLSQAAKKLKPGYGVYRSSFKNAMRVARSETNMAYRTADHERWKTQDFVLGFEVKLSHQHGITDICDELKGQYPKSFLFTSWHPQCYCFVIPLRMDKGDFIKKLNGEKVEVNTIGELPENFNKFMEKNGSMLESMKNKPYWLEDNKKLIKGLL